MESPVPGLDTREFAIVFWLSLAFLASLLNRKLRGGVGGVLRRLAAWKILVIFAAMALYIWGLLSLLSVARLWDGRLVSETVFWLLPATALLFRAVTSSDEDFFRKTVKSVVTVAIIVEFLINLRPAGLALELILFPTLLVLVATNTYGSLQKGQEQSTAFLGGVIGAVGVILLGYTIAGMIGSPERFFTYENLLELLTPILLTLGFIPFVYATALYTTYGTFFTRIELNVDDRSLRRYAKRQGLQRAHVRLTRVQVLASKAGWFMSPSGDRARIGRAIDRALGE
jgi:hypothetical protein